MKKINKKGYSLIEILLVLAIVAIMSVAIFAIYNKIQQERKTEKMISDIQQATSYLNSLSENHISMEGIATNSLMQRQIFPLDDFKTNDKKNLYYSYPPITPFGDMYLIGVTGNYGFTIYINSIKSYDMSVGSCYKFLKAVVPIFRQVYLNNDIVYMSLGATNNGTGIDSQNNSSKIMSYCQDAHTSGNYQFQFTSYSEAGIFNV